jgi:hypothetical protein
MVEFMFYIFNLFFYKKLKNIFFEETRIYVTLTDRLNSSYPPPVSLSLLVLNPFIMEFEVFQLSCKR